MAADVQALEDGRARGHTRQVVLVLILLVLLELLRLLILLLQGEGRPKLFTSDAVTAAGWPATLGQVMGSTDLLPTHG